GGGADISPNGSQFAVSVRLGIDDDRLASSEKSGALLPDGTPRTRLGNRLLIGSFARLGERPHLISPFDSWHPAWSPDGMKLAYFSNETGAIHLWIYDVESQQRRPVGHLAVNTLPLETRYWPVWSADG